MGETSSLVSEYTAQEGASRAYSETGGNYFTSHLQTHEQFFSPISIRKGSVSIKPGFDRGFAQFGEDGIFQGNCAGPTAGELNPYFSNTFNSTNTFLRNTDFMGMVHDVLTTDDQGNTSVSKPSDINIRAAADRGDNTDNVYNVRVNALRGPLIVSGWGFGIDDMPVPPSGGPISDMGGMQQGVMYPAKVRHHPDIGKDRRLWKTGPINLMWDDERKVWQGGLPVICGIAMEAIEAPESPCKPTEFTIKLFRNTGSDSATSEGGSDFTGPITSALGEEVVIKNRDMSLEEDYIENAIFVIAMKINYEWLPIWVGCPDEGPTETDCIPEGVFPPDP